MKSKISRQSGLDKFRKAAAEREKKHAEIEKQSKEKPNLKAAIDRLQKHVNNEDVPVNNVSGGNIAGVGVGPQGEPGVKLRDKKKVVPFAIFTRKTPSK